ncbi:MAG: undecaprenyldiphospho-muramoylpentapeptide beta-N-acetylglucosaminyltransferase [Acidimicrobiales bacterium]
MAVFAMISGGGTAGHVVPGLAVADALVERGHDWSSIHYVGSERGVERTMVPDAGFPLTLLPGRGIQRRLTFDNVAATIGLLRAIVRAVGLVRRERPAVLLALGGYASVPAALAAALWRVPIVVAEQNAVPGAANRLVARFAKASAVSFPNTALPRAVLTGNPVRREVRMLATSGDRAAARASVGLRGEDERVLIVAFGGSLGARRINDAVLALAQSWRDRDDVALRHVIGERDWAGAAERVSKLSDELERRRRAGEPSLRYDAVRYEHDMPTVYAAADLIVCRSGASTVAELAVAGIPSVLVPLPHAPGDHQTANARAMVEAGGACLLTDADADPDHVADVLDGLVRDRDRRVRMAGAARSLARPDAAERVADLVERNARPPRPLGSGESRR